MDNRDATLCLKRPKLAGEPAGTASRSTSAPLITLRSDIDGPQTLVLAPDAAKTVSEPMINLPKSSPPDDQPSVFDGVRHCPVYYPTIEQFENPLAFIESIRQEAEQYGICKIVPPKEWQPDFKLQDTQFKFGTRLQPTYKLYNRLGSTSVFEEALKLHLAKEGIVLDKWPAIGGIDVDLAAMDRVVNEFGGCQCVIDNGLWPSVAARIRVPLLKERDEDRLQAYYYKYLLSYSLLSPDEVLQLHQQAMVNLQATSDERARADFGFGNGRQHSLASFRKIADAFKSTWYPHQDPTKEQVEQDYWNTVEGHNRVSVLYGSDIDSTVHGSGFATSLDDPYAKFGWNLNVLPGLPQSVLKHASGISGISMPWLYVGMLFSSFCWHVEDNYLYSINYMHFGGGKRWYAAPASHAEHFEASFRRRLPEEFDRNPHLLHDIVTQLSPRLLVEDGVPVCTTVQQAREFVVTFPRAYHGGYSDGYNCCEAVNFAKSDWLQWGYKAMHDYRLQCRPVSLDQVKLVLEIAAKEGQASILQHALPLVHHIIAKHKQLRAAVLQSPYTASMDYETFARAYPQALVFLNQQSQEETRNTGRMQSSTFSTEAKPTKMSALFGAGRMAMSTTRTRHLDEQPLVCDRCRHVCSLATLYVPDPGEVPPDPNDMWVEEAQELLRHGNFACLECALEYVLPFPKVTPMQLVDIRPLSDLERILARVERMLRSAS
eukprot:TRINITY_DN12416_c4_g2_i2.p1 TRINITY_DN12416_c4_g2~~TRINITY_DN12416_c4_g2_i2.p1  ORF type:complete len:715 (+),score=150.71 TRINITY_DN12416_c4_g2_i2:152-2296(+)